MPAKSKTFVVIMGAGRCGTSNLLSYLNSKPNFNIFGENNGSVLDLLSALSNLKITHERSLGKEKTNDYVSPYCKEGWYNNVGWYNDRDKINKLFLNTKQNIVNFFDSNYKYIGFKEIRWNCDLNNLCILESIYTTVKYIFLKRNLQDQIKSWQKCGWIDDEELIISKINLKNTSIENYLINKIHYKCNISNNANFLEEAYNFILQEPHLSGK